MTRISDFHHMLAANILHFSPRALPVLPVSIFCCVFGGFSNSFAPFAGAVWAASAPHTQSRSSDLLDVTQPVPPIPSPQALGCSSSLAAGPLPPPPGAVAPAASGDGLTILGTGGAADQIHASHLAAAPVPPAAAGQLLLGRSASTESADLFQLSSSSGGVSPGVASLQKSGSSLLGGATQLRGVREADAATCSPAATQEVQDLTRTIANVLGAVGTVGAAGSGCSGAPGASVAAAVGSPEGGPRAAASFAPGFTAGLAPPSSTSSAASDAGRALLTELRDFAQETAHRLDLIIQRAAGAPASATDRKSAGAEGSRDGVPQTTDQHGILRPNLQRRLSRSASAQPSTTQNAPSGDPPPPQNQSNRSTLLRRIEVDTAARAASECGHESAYNFRRQRPGASNTTHGHDPAASPASAAEKHQQTVNRVRRMFSCDNLAWTSNRREVGQEALDWQRSEVLLQQREQEVAAREQALRELELAQLRNKEAAAGSSGPCAPLPTTNVHQTVLAATPCPSTTLLLPMRSADLLGGSVNAGGGASVTFAPGAPASPCVASCTPATTRTGASAVVRLQASPPAAPRYLSMRRTSGSSLQVGPPVDVMGRVVSRNRSTGALPPAAVASATATLPTTVLGPLPSPHGAMARTTSPPVHGAGHDTGNAAAPTATLHEATHIARVTSQAAQGAVLQPVFAQHGGVTVPPLLRPGGPRGPLVYTGAQPPYQVIGGFVVPAAPTPCSAVSRPPFPPQTTILGQHSPPASPFLQHRNLNT